MELKLDAKKILDNEFHVDFKGYRAIEVDEFLDVVISDYQKFDEIVASLTNKINQLELQNSSLKAQVMELESRQALQNVGNEENISQTDIIKRLVKLENEVYSKLR